MDGITRRSALRYLGAAACAGWALGCRDEEPPRRARIADPLGDPFETLKVRGYRGLAELPYFELDGDGRLRLTVDDLAPGVDFHAHLAFNMFLAPQINLHERTQRVRYLIDCDAVEPPCVFDLDVYMNKIADEDMLEDMEWEMMGMLALGSSAAETYTIPNLVAEMDRFGFERAVLLAIASGLPFRDHLTRWWHDSLQSSAHRDRFVLYGSVHPTAADAPEELRELARLGIRGVKLHPTMQRFYPDDPRAMRIYEVCEELRLPVFFHAGRAGIEPELTRKHAVMKHYVAPVRDFPKLPFVFGHAGARDWQDAYPIARDHENVWLDIQGQGVTPLRTIIREVGPERLVYGSDWPFYPLAAQLGKVLVATRNDRRVRDMIIGDNARRLLAWR